MGLVKIYLILYNLAQALGWGCLLYRLLPFIQKQVTDTKGFFPARNPKSLYEELGFHVELVQTAAMLEILHAILGFVKSSPAVTAKQILRYHSYQASMMTLFLFTLSCLFSRLGVVWVPLHFVLKAQTSPGVTLVLFAWSLTETIRYPYYALNLINVNVGLLTWLRYTLFIFLYPMGVTGELWCYCDSLSFWKTGKLFSIALPNQWNFTFSPYVLIVMVLIMYIPGFPPMYFHMFGQRRKVLGRSSDEVKKQS